MFEVEGRREVWRSVGQDGGGGGGGGAGGGTGWEGELEKREGVTE